MSVKVKTLVLTQTGISSLILTDWNDESGESVTTNDASIVHDILRSDLPIIA